MHKTHNPFCIVIVYDYGRKEIKRKNSSLLLRHISDKDPGTQIVKSGGEQEVDAFATEPLRLTFKC